MNNLPAEPVNVIAEDPVTPELLYVGTDLGVSASLDAGATWVSRRGDLPTVAVFDLVVHPREPDLIIATHGRSRFVLDLVPSASEWRSDRADFPLRWWRRPPVDGPLLAGRAFPALIPCSRIVLILSGIPA